MKILIVEDNSTVVIALSQGFKYKNIVTDHCMEGKEGLKKLLKNKYDLAIIDLELPGMRGEDIIKKAKEQGIKTPLLVLTGHREIDTKAMLLDVGADDYMEKPYSFEELYARIMAILRRNGQIFPSEFLTIEDIELIPDKRVAMRGKKDIGLRGKEYELLKYFMSHPNVVLSRNTLMEEVWGYSNSVSSNTVDAHISSLRNKLDKGHSKKFIKTVHGVGYMFQF